MIYNQLMYLLNQHSEKYKTTAFLQKKIYNKLLNFFLFSTAFFLFFVFYFGPYSYLVLLFILYVFVFGIFLTELKYSKNCFFKVLPFFIFLIEKEDYKKCFSSIKQDIKRKIFFINESIEDFKRIYSIPLSVEIYKKIEKKRTKKNNLLEDLDFLEFLMTLL